MGKFLDKTGFAYFWTIIKSELAKKADTNHSHNASDIMGCPAMTKLWENASPTSSFAAQTLDVSVSGYDWIAIRFRATSSVARGGVIFVSTNGGGDILHVMSGTTPSMRSRRISFSSNNPVFNAGYLIRPSSSSFSGTEDNENIIPVDIHGVKIEG